MIGGFGYPHNQPNRSVVASATALTVPCSIGTCLIVTGSSITFSRSATVTLSRTQTRSCDYHEKRTENRRTVFWRSTAVRKRSNWMCWHGQRGKELGKASKGNNQRRPSARGG